MLDGAPSIDELENVTWLNGREFSERQMEFWFQRDLWRGQNQDEDADEIDSQFERPGPWAA